MTEDEDWIAEQKPNLPTLEHLYSTPAHELARLSVEELSILQASLSKEQARVRRMTENFHAAVTTKLQDRFVQAYAAQGKDTGKVTIVEGEIIVSCEIRKDVKWDQKILLAVWATMVAAGKDPRDFIKTELSVPEAVFGKLSTETRDLLMAARTTKPGKPAYMFADKRHST